MKKISKVKSKLFYFSLGVIACSVVGVAAATYFPSNDVTYDNTESGLTSTNVQGAIDELYNACKTPSSGGDGILDNVDIVTSGDGLYKDNYEDRYIYKGKNPNNYVTFNNEQAGWRIISVESDKTIKIVRNVSIGNECFVSSCGYSANYIWSAASLNSYLNETYYNSLTSTAQNQIVAHNFSVGNIRYSYYNSTPLTLAQTIERENKNTWYGKIALITSSEYIRTNSNPNKCGTIKLLDDNTTSCNNSNWMYHDGISWTLNHDEDDFGYYLTSGRFYNTYCCSTSFYGNVYPVVHLSPNITLKGNGTKNDPFVIE